MKKVICCAIILMSFFSVTAQSSDRKLYDPSWLPPPVGVTGNVQTKPVEKEPDPPVVEELKQEKSSTFTSLEELRSLINKRLAENFSYPVQAKERHIEGTVELLLSISKDGTLLSWKKRGNPPAILLKSAVSQITDVFPLPVSLKTSVPDFAVTITYTLE